MSTDSSPPPAPPPPIHPTNDRFPNSSSLLHYNFLMNMFGVYTGGGENRNSAGLWWFWLGFRFHEKQPRSFVDLYSSLRWNSIVSHADFLEAFYPERATSPAFGLVSELVEELRIKPCPAVFIAFSGGSKACMYKVFQIIQGTCEGHLSADESILVRNCDAGHIYDSSPVDFTSDFCARFSLQPTIQKMPGTSKLVSWVAKGIASVLDGLCLTRFDSQRAEYWWTLYSSVDLEAPFLTRRMMNLLHHRSSIISLNVYKNLGEMLS